MDAGELQQPNLIETKSKNFVNNNFLSCYQIFWVFLVDNIFLSQTNHIQFCGEI